MILQVVIVQADDWQGLYINDCLVAQGHHITPEDILDALKLPLEEWEADPKWVEGISDLPDHLSQVKRAKP